MKIKLLTDNAEKQKVTRLILEALPDWFGIPEARENYIAESIDNIFFCAYDGERPFRWENTRNMTGRTDFIFPLAFRNLKCSPHYGMNGTPARYIL